jgi:flagellar FliL protein
MSDKTEAAPTPKKKGKAVKMILAGVALLALVGGGVGAGLYASSAGLIGGKAEAAEDTGPKLVPKSEEKRASAKADGDKAGSDKAEEAGESTGGGKPTPKGEGGDAYASSYFTLEKEFTSNLKESVHFIQVGIAVSTPYDEKVIENLKTHEIAVRSAVLLTLGETAEDAVFTTDGKEALQQRLVASINRVLKQKEGFGGVSNVYFTNFVVQ